MERHQALRKTVYEIDLCYSNSLQWRHNEHDSVSNHQPHDCLLNRLFGRRSKKTSKLRVTGNCARTGEFTAQQGPVNSPHKWPVTRKVFPFDDVIMWCQSAISYISRCHAAQWLFSYILFQHLIILFPRKTWKTSVGYGAGWTREVVWGTLIMGNLRLPWQ